MNRPVPKDGNHVKARVEERHHSEVFGVRALGEGFSERASNRRRELQLRFVC